MVNTMSDGDVVVVTGAAGFLGQHLVKLFQEKTLVKEIRSFDIQEYRNKLGHEERIAVTNYVGDLRNPSDLEKAFAGADVVFHIASLIDISSFPDERMEEVNVRGTSSVIAACIQMNIPRLVYTGSVDLVVDSGWDDVNEVTETVPYPTSHIHGYGSTKCRAEQLVLAANGKQLKDGGATLRTISLRPAGIYGELSTLAVTKAIEHAKASGGIYYKFTKEGKQTLAYAGNVAWAHIVTSRALKDDPKLGGEAFFVTDDTPDLLYSDFVEPFLKCFGYSLSKFKVSIWIIYFLCYVVYLLCLLVRPIRRIGPMFATPGNLRRMCRNLTFSGEKARRLLGYKPLFTYKECLERCIAYYTDLKL